METAAGNRGLADDDSVQQWLRGVRVWSGEQESAIMAGQPGVQGLHTAEVGNLDEFRMPRLRVHEATPQDQDTTVTAEPRTIALLHYPGCRRNTEGAALPGPQPASPGGRHDDQMDEADARLELPVQVREVEPGTADFELVLALANRVLAQDRHLTSHIPGTLESHVLGAFHGTECAGFLRYLIQVIGAEAGRPAVIRDGEPLSSSGPAGPPPTAPAGSGRRTCPAAPPPPGRARWTATGRP
jgi:hypothetical protein